MRDVPLTTEGSLLVFFGLGSLFVDIRNHRCGSPRDNLRETSGLRRLSDIILSVQFLFDQWIYIEQSNRYESCSSFVRLKRMTCLMHVRMELKQDWLTNER